MNLRRASGCDTASGYFREKDTTRGEHPASQWFPEEEWMSVTALLMNPQKTRVSVAHMHAICCQKCCFSPSASRVEFIGFSRGVFLCSLCLTTTSCWSKIAVPIPMLTVSIIAVVSTKHFGTSRLGSSCRPCSGLQGCLPLLLIWNLCANQFHLDARSFLRAHSAAEDNLQTTLSRSSF